MTRKHASNDAVTPRLFDDPVLEHLTRAHPVLPVAIFGPVVCVALAMAIGRGGGLPAIAGAFVVGFLAWTLLEYVIHRYIFHLTPKSAFWQRVLFVAHGVHHDYPRDPMRLVMPPVISIPAAMIFYFVIRLAVGPMHAPAMFAGLVFGYVCYDTLHFAVHHFSLKRNPLGKRLRAYHFKHHYQDDDARFGITTPLWDAVFGTLSSRAGRSSATGSR